MIKKYKNFLKINKYNINIGDYVKLTYFIKINNYLSNKVKIIDKERIYINNILKTTQFKGIDEKGNIIFFNEEDISRNLRKNEIFPVDIEYEPINHIKDTLKDYNI